MRFTVVILSALLCLSARGQGLSERDADEDIVAAAEKMVNEGLTTETKTEATVTETAKEAPASVVESKNENEIPVFTKSEKQAKSEGTLIWRLVASLGFLVVVGGAMMFVSRRYTRQKNKGGEKTRIEVLHQYHLGPKRSLVLIRIAGEAMLIGATDQAVNMIKPITLIDEEIEGVFNNRLNGFLEDEFTVEDMRSAMQQTSARG